MRCFTLRETFNGTLNVEQLTVNFAQLRVQQPYSCGHLLKTFKFLAYVVAASGKQTDQVSDPILCAPRDERMSGLNNVESFIR